MSQSERVVREAVLFKYLENPTISLLKISKDLKTSYSTVKRTISKYRRGISIERKRGSGRKPGPSHPDVIKKMKNTYSRKPRTSERDMATLAGTSKSTVHRYKKSCGLRTYKVQKVPLRKEEEEKTARKRARKLYEKFLTKYDCVVMDDETYCKADFSQMPGDEYFTAKCRSDVHKNISTKGMTKFPKKSDLAGDLFLWFTRQ